MHNYLTKAAINKLKKETFEEETRLDETTMDEISLGKKVSLTFLEDSELQEFTIVSSLEADPMESRISIESPLGHAIYRHKVGDVVPVDCPQGCYKVRIESIIGKTN